MRIIIHTDIVSNKKYARYRGDIIDIPYWIVAKYGYSINSEILDGLI